MHTEDYAEAINYANYIANYNSAHKINSVHLLAGILHLRHSEVTILLNRYGITLGWIKKYLFEHSLKYINFKVLYYDNTKVPFGNGTDLIILFSETLASNNRTPLDVEHLAYNLINAVATTSTMVKKYVKNYTDLLAELLVMIDKKSNNKKFANQVTIE